MGEHFMNHDVTNIFNKFAGQEIAVTETEKTHKMRNGQDYKYTHIAFADENDPLLTGMRETADKHGLSLRIWLPNSMGTCDMRMDRVNVHVNKDEDGKWRIGKQFNLG
jgi:hypothetical protein